MRNVILFSIPIFIILFTANSIQAQFSPFAKVKYSDIEGKVLYIPSYESSSKYIDKWAKKGMYRKILKASDKGAFYNNAWREALKESGFAESNYKFTETSSKDHIKAQCKDCLLLQYKREGMGGDKVNVTAFITIAHPSKKIITRANVNTLDLSDKNDIRLMLNMLSSNLNLVTSLAKTGDLSIGKAMAQGRQNSKDFVSSMSDKTFLIPKPDASTKKGKKALVKLEEALSQWTLSKTKLSSVKEIEELRAAGDENSFYLRIIPQYIDQFKALHLNLLISTADDTVLQAYIGGKNLNAKSLLAIQSLLIKHGK